MSLELYVQSFKLTFAKIAYKQFFQWPPQGFDAFRLNYFAPLVLNRRSQTRRFRSITRDFYTECKRNSNAETKEPRPFPLDVHRDQ
jgi:hypothetical protein